MAKFGDWKKLAEDFAYSSCLYWNAVLRRTVTRYGYKWIDDKLVLYQRSPKPFFREVDVFEDKRYLVCFLEYRGGSKINVHIRSKKLLSWLSDRKMPLHSKKAFFRIVEEKDWPATMGGSEKMYKIRMAIGELPEAAEMRKRGGSEYYDWFEHQLALRVSKRMFKKMEGHSEEDYRKGLEYNVRGEQDG